MNSVLTIKKVYGHQRHGGHRNRGQMEIADKPIGGTSTY